MKKLKLQIDALAVDSFRPDAGAAGREPGTVHGQAECTYFDTCLCKTAYYQCGTGPYTVYSCTPTTTAAAWTPRTCSAPPRRRSHRRKPPTNGRWTMKKTRLNADALTVESFPTADVAGASPRGTVHGAAPCTHWESCVCPTAYYHCGDGYDTLYSCTYTHEPPCFGSYDDCS